MQDEPTRVHSMDGIATQAAPTISAFSPGVSFALSVFDTICAPATARGRVLFRRDAHLDRLLASADAMGIDGMPARATLAEWVEDAAARLPAQADAHLRITAIGDTDDGRLMSPVRARVAIRAEVRPIRGLSESLRRCHLSRWRKPAADALPGRVKSAANYATARRALTEARQAGCDAALLLGDDGRVAEGPAATFFAVREGVLTTPPLTANILDGITRRTLLDLAAREGLDAREAPIEVAALAEADEAFFASTGQGIEPVVTLAGRALPAAPGPVTRVLHALYVEALRGA